MFSLLFNNLPAVIAGLRTPQLDQINQQLTNLGLPTLALGATTNHHYRTRATPRFLIGWKGITLNEVYLNFMVNQKENPELFEIARTSLPFVSQYMTYNHSIGVQQIDYPLTFTFN